MCFLNFGQVTTKSHREKQICGEDKSIEEISVILQECQSLDHNVRLV
jgi:hypothetical protein